MKKIKTIILGLMAALLLAGCANSTTQIDSTHKKAEETSLKEKGQKEMYTNEGYIQGKIDGFKDGIAWSKQLIKNFKSKMKALQFSNYLIKEKFITPGEIYINPRTNQITFGKMSISRPYTMADIYNKFASKLPTYMNEEENLTKELDSIMNKKSKLLEKNKNTGKKTGSESFNATLFKKESSSEILNKKAFQPVFAKVKRNDSNFDLIQKLGLDYTVFKNEVDYYTIKFKNQKLKEVICNNFDRCISY